MRKILMLLILSLMTVFSTGCATRAGSGGTGAVIGGGTGAIIGNQTGRPLEGAIIGTVIGGVVGLFVHDDDEHTHTEPQREVYIEGQPQQETIKIKRKKVIEVEEEIPVHKEERRYYIDHYGRKVYIDKKPRQTQ